MAKTNVRAICDEFDNLWDRITQIPLWEVCWDFTEDDEDIPTDGPSVCGYDTSDDDYEEVCTKVLKGRGRHITEPTDAFIINLLANDIDEAVELATEAYNEFYGL